MVLQFIPYVFRGFERNLDEGRGLIAVICAQLCRFDHRFARTGVRQLVVELSREKASEADANPNLRE